MAKMLNDVPGAFWCGWCHVPEGKQHKPGCEAAAVLSKLGRLRAERACLVAEFQEVTDNYVAEVKRLRAVAEAALVIAGVVWLRHNPIAGANMGTWGCVFCGGRTGADPFVVSHQEDCLWVRLNETLVPASAP